MMAEENQFLNIDYESPTHDAGDLIDPDDANSATYPDGTGDNLKRVYTRKIVYQYENGKQVAKPVINSVKFLGSGILDEKTGEYVTLDDLGHKKGTGSLNWITEPKNAVLPKVVSPALPGCRVNIRIVNEQTVANPINHTDTVKVIYYAKSQRAKVTVLDNKTSEKLTDFKCVGRTGSEVKFNVQSALKDLLKKGYVWNQKGSLKPGTRFTADKHQAFTIRLDHKMITKPHANKTAKQIVHYVDQAGQELLDPVEQTFEFTHEPDKYDAVTNQNLSDEQDDAQDIGWKQASHQFDSVNVPVIKGYVTDKTKAGSLTATPKDSVVEQDVVYQPMGRLVAVDDMGNQLPNTKAEPYLNNLDDPTKAELPHLMDVEGYYTDAKSLKMTAPSKDTKVVFKPLYAPLSESKTIFRTIVLDLPKKKAKQIVQKVVLTHHGKYNLQTGDVEWDKWDTKIWKKVDVPQVTGYKTNLNMVKEVVVDSNTLDTRVEVTYEPIVKQIAMTLLDTDTNQVLKKVTLKGKPGDQVDTGLSLLDNYVPVIKGVVIPKTYTFKEHNDDVTYKLKHDTKRAVKKRPVERKILVTYPDGHVKTIKQEAVIARSGVQDMVTKKINWGAWTKAVLVPYKPERLKNYVVSKKVPLVKVNEHTKDMTVEISYNSVKLPKLHPDDSADKADQTNTKINDARLNEDFLSARRAELDDVSDFLDDSSLSDVLPDADDMANQVEKTMDDKGDKSLLYDLSNQLDQSQSNAESNRFKSFVIQQDTGIDDDEGQEQKRSSKQAKAKAKRSAKQQQEQDEFSDLFADFMERKHDKTDNQSKHDLDKLVSDQDAGTAKGQERPIKSSDEQNNIGFDLEDLGGLDELDGSDDDANLDE